MADGYFKSNIQDLTDEYIGISIPVLEGRYLSLRKDEMVEVLYYFDKEVYSFTTTVIGRKIDKIFIVLLAHPEKIKIVQRRNYYRVPISLDICCAIVEKEKNLTNMNDNQFEFFDAITLDLSGGGVRVISNKLMKYGEHLMVTLPIFDEFLTILGKIVRIQKKDDGKNIYGVSFLNVDNITRDKLIRFIFQKTRDYIKKGVGGEI
jgi:c-di-GMP-binding flagellar brake protein YcgR